MKQRPSNVLIYVLLSIVAAFGLYALGGLILDARDGEIIEQTN